MPIFAALDFGNNYCVVATPQNGGVDVIPNSSGKRLTPTMVSYGGNRRYAGDRAQNNQMQDVSSCIIELKRLVGLKFDSPQREIVARLSTAELEPLPDGLTGVLIAGTVMRPEQVIAFLLEFLFSMVKGHDGRVGGFVIAVSPWWTELHRRLMLDAAKISGINCLTLVNSTTAAAVNYAVSHRARLPEEGEEPVDVLFIDFGDSSVNVCVCKITKVEVAVSSFACDEHLGGSDFTDALYNYLSEKVQRDFGFNPSKDKRTELRFRKAVEVAKKNLSINPVVVFDLSDNNISFQVKRTEFESLIGDLIERIEKPVVSALELAHIDKDKLFAAEVLGGASRVPAVKSEIQRILGREPRQSVNVDECFAVGAGYFSAILSPSFRISMTVHDIAPHGVTCEWDDVEGHKTHELFGRFSQVPSTAEVAMQLNGKANISFNNDQGLIGTATVMVEESDVPKKVNVRVTMTQSSVIEVVDAVLEDQSAVPITFDCVLGLAPGVIAKCQQDNRLHAAQDLREEEIDNVRNDLETLIFEAENGLTRDFRDYIDPSEVEGVQGVVSQVHQWFDEHEFERCPAGEYRQRIKELKQVTEAPKERYRLWKRMCDSIDSFTRRATSISERLAAIKSSKLNDKKESFATFSKQMMKNIETAQAAPRQSNPPLDVDALDKALTEWETNVTTWERESKKSKMCEVA